MQEDPNEEKDQTRELGLEERKRAKRRWRCLKKEEELEQGRWRKKRKRNISKRGC